MANSVSTVLREVRAVPTLEQAAALAELTARLFRSRARRPELARYRILQRVGAGGLGVVFAAQDPVLDRRVAVKLVRRRGGPDDKSLHRLTREAQMIARVCHPALVQVFDIGWYGPGDLGTTPPEDVPPAGLFIVMEMVEGIDMKAWITQRPAPAEILRVFTAAGEGLAAAHRVGVVHRDFKPANVIIGPRGVKVLDFGLAWHDAASTESSPTGPRPVSETVTGSVVGTPLYMAPEQHEGLTADARADQYAFCVSLAEAWLGHRLFPGGGVEAIHAAKRSLRLADHRALPRDLRSVLQRGLAIDPRDRYPSMDALIADLRGRRAARKRTIGWSVLATATLATLWAWDPATAAGGRDCDAEAAAVVERMQATRSEERGDATDLARAIRAREVDELSQLREQLAQACRADGTVPSTAVSQSCVAARDAQRDALIETLAESSQSRGPTSAAAWRAVAMNETCLRTEPDSEESVAIMAHIGRARALEILDHYEDANAELDAAIALARRHDRPRLEARGMLAQGVLLERWKPGEGVSALEQAYFVAEKIGDADVATRAAVRMTWAAARYEGGTAAERWRRHADAQLDRARADEVPTEELEGEVAWGALATGSYEDAIAHAERALQLHSVVSPHDDIKTTKYLGVIVHAAARLGDLARAEATSRREVGALVAALGHDHPDVADARGTLSAVLIEQQRYDEALQQSREALEVNRHWASDDHPAVGLHVARIGKALAGLGRYGEAIEHYEEAKRLWSKVPYTDPYVAEADLNLAIAWAALGDDARSRDLALACAERAEQLGRPGDTMPERARALAADAQARLAAHDQG